MSKYNGSGILLYADGVEFAAQKGFTLNANVNLFDITTKQSSGWAEHDKGVRSADISFDALQSTTGKSNYELFAYISDRKSMVLLISGFTYPIIGEVDCSSMSMNAPTEEATGLSGTLKFKGPLYRLAGGSANLLTDPDAGGSSYDTLTISGTAITSAVNLAGVAATESNTFAITSGSTYKVITFFVKNTGEWPSFVLSKPGVGDKSNAVQVVEGVNVITLVATASDNVVLKLFNSNPGAWAMTTIYCFKV